VSSSDTQPMFLLAFALSLAVAVGAPRAGAKLYRISLSSATAWTFAALVIFACLVAANARQDDSTIPARLVSFLQFCAAAVWGYAAKFRWNSKVLFGALLVYAVFTVVYFVTNGAIEDALIRSRMEGAEYLFASGRGARTLAPEPSFFALHVFNLFVLSKLLRVDEGYGSRKAFVWFALVVSCLASTFSAYGAVLLLVVLLVTYPKVSVLLGLALVSSFGVFKSQLLNWEGVRAVKVMVALIESRGRMTELMFLDPSFASRIGSFMEYVASFARHPLVGDGFSLYQGGGFVSIVSAFGIVALLFFAALVSKILLGGFSVATKAALLIWFALNFLSGPVGVPILGVIVGMLFRTRGQAFLASDSETAPAHGPFARVR